MCAKCSVCGSDVDRLPFRTQDGKKVCSVICAQGKREDIKKKQSFGVY